MSESNLSSLQTLMSLFQQPALPIRPAKPDDVFPDDRVAELRRAIESVRNPSTLVEILRATTDAREILPGVSDLCASLSHLGRVFTIPTLQVEVGDDRPRPMFMGPKPAVQLTMTPISSKVFGSSFSTALVQFGLNGLAVKGVDAVRGVLVDDSHPKALGGAEPPDRWHPAGRFISVVTREHLRNVDTGVHALYQSDMLCFGPVEPEAATLVCDEMLRGARTNGKWWLSAECDDIMFHMFNYVVGR